MRIRWAQAAVADVESIGAYLEEHSPSLTESTLLRLYEAAQSLKRFSSRGRIGRVVGRVSSSSHHFPILWFIWSLNQTCTSSECSTAHRTGRGWDASDKKLKNSFSPLLSVGRSTQDLPEFGSIVTGCDEPPPVGRKLCGCKAGSILKPSRRNAAVQLAGDPTAGRDFVDVNE